MGPTRPLGSGNFTSRVKDTWTSSKLFLQNWPLCRCYIYTLLMQKIGKDGPKTVLLVPATELLALLEVWTASVPDQHCQKQDRCILRKPRYRRWSKLPDFGMPMEISLGSWRKLQCPLGLHPSGLAPASCPRTDNLRARRETCARGHLALSSKDKRGLDN